MHTPRDAELLNLAQSSALARWLPSDLFPGRPVPYWAVLSIDRMVGLGLVVRERVGPCRWAYRLPAVAADAE